MCVYVVHVYVCMNVIDGTGLSISTGFHVNLLLSPLRHGREGQRSLESATSTASGLPSQERTLQELMASPPVQFLFLCHAAHLSDVNRTEEVFESCVPPLCEHMSAYT